MQLGAVRHLFAAFLVIVLILGIGCAKAPNDSQITEQIRAKLSQDSGLHEKSLSVQTSGGVVTLSGTVDNNAQRTAASRYASTVPGIKEVVNNLQIATAVAPASTPAIPPSAPAVSTPAVSVAKPVVGVHTRTKSDSANQEPSKASSSGSDSSNATDNSALAAAANQPADSSPISSPDAPAAPATPPPPPAPKNLTIQAGTNVAVRLVDTIDSETARVGQTFRATLDSPLSSEWDVAIPAGYNVEGHVVDVKSAGKFAGQSQLILQLDRISAGGKSYDLQTDQYRRQGSNRSTNTAEKVGAGAVLGAIIGGIAGGGKGAGIGAAAGGGVGGGVQAASKGQQIKLTSETVLNFTLKSPLTVTQVDQEPGTERPKLDTPQ